MANISDVEAPFLAQVVDHKDRPITRSKSGGWKSAYFIIGVEVAERFAYYGISSNLINYLTGPLGQSTATAAENVNAWSGTAFIMPLLGAFIADSFLGRYRTIIISSVLYVLGLSILTFSAVFSLNSLDCQNPDNIKACSPPDFQVLLFFAALYLVAFAQGGHKPCAQAFGADQFDAQDPEECKEKSSFFNWWTFGVSAGGLVAVAILSYIQENISWALGFGIPCIIMVIALTVFLFGSFTYRIHQNSNEKNAVVRIGGVFITAVRNWQRPASSMPMQLEEQGIIPHEDSQQFKFLHKALLTPDGSEDTDKVISFDEVVEAKSVLRLTPIWSTCLVYAIVSSQTSTLFTKQGTTMDRSIGSNFQIPAASLQCFSRITLVVLIPIYDCILVPLVRATTRKPSGITMLQRIGIGIFVSILSVVSAAITEKIRLRTALEFGLLDNPEATVPMSIWWLIPQYLLFGISEIFTLVGLQEFFYDQMPSELKSLGLALYLSLAGVGSFLSSFLISFIVKATAGNGQDSWFSDNLNRAHLDYFYWILSGLSVLSFTFYLYIARSYVYKNGSAL